MVSSRSSVDVRPGQRALRAGPPAAEAAWLAVTRSPRSVRTSVRSSVATLRCVAIAPRLRIAPIARRPPARSARPRGVSRRSALSIRSSRRCSARDVNIRYGSRHPRVTRSSTRTPMYASSRPSVNGGSPPDRPRRVDAGDESLRRRLLVPRRAVDLPREEEPADSMRLERRLQLRRLHEVVLDRVARPQHHGVLEARQRVNELLLDLARQRHREAVDVDLVDVEAFRLEIDLVPLPVGEPHDLVFERRTVARTDALNLSVVERAAIDDAANEIAHAIVRVQQPAADLISQAALVVETKTAPGLRRPLLDEDSRPRPPDRSRCCRRWSRGGVPVFSRPIRIRTTRIDSASSRDGGSPCRPAGRCSGPT